MTSTSYYYDHGAGLSVSMPNVMYNIYYMNTDYKSTHYHYTMASGLLASQGERVMPGGGHYGMVDTDDHKVMFSCHWSSTSYCSQGLRKIHTYGDGAHYDVRSTTLTSQLIVGQTTSISRAITSINVEGIFGSVPTGTSINVDVSNDGGTTWKSGAVGQKVNFANSGTSIKWRATLNGSASKTPVLGDVVLTYTTNYQTSGYYYAYQYIGSGSSGVIAATVDWNETRPAGTSISVNVGYKASSSSCNNGNSGVQTYTAPNTTKSMTGTYYYYCVRIALSTSSTGITPTISDLSIALHSNAPNQPGLNIDGASAWKRSSSAGALIGPVTVTSQQSGNTLLDKLNDAIPDTGSGMVDIPIELTAESAGKLSITSFEITYVMQTVNLDLTIPEGEILHERITPYEVVSQHVIGESATSMVSAELTLMTAGSAANWPVCRGSTVMCSPTPTTLHSTSRSTQRPIRLRATGFSRFIGSSSSPVRCCIKTASASALVLDDSGTAGFAPEPLVSDEGLRVNRSFGLGWLNVRDNEGELTSQDVEDDSWVAAGEQIHFVGAMWFQDTDDAPKDSAFDVRISKRLALRLRPGTRPTITGRSSSPLTCPPSTFPTV